MNLLDAILASLDINDAIDAAHGVPASLRILPLGEQGHGSSWLIQFYVENLTKWDIAIEPTVTATFKTGAGESDAAFVISGSDTTVPAMTKKSFSALARNQSIKPTKPYSLYQIHVTPLAMVE